MPLIEECIQFFGCDDLYRVLEISKEVADRKDKVKKAYHKLSLKVHPDRVPEECKEEATKKFQILGKVYSILSDQEKRTVYDETGQIDEDDIQQDKDWYAYWRLLFAKVSVKDIQEFQDKYKGSEEELEDLKSAYKEFKGDMDEIMDNVLCATADDEERFRDILLELISNKEIPNYKKFSREKISKAAARVKKAEKEAAEAEELKKELGMDVDDSLKDMIMKRNSSREKDADSFFAQLEAKYAKPKKTKKGK